MTREGFVLLGCPIGSPTFCASTVLGRVKKVQELLCLLPDMEDSQMEVTLLRSCLALPKIAFVLRTCPPSYIQKVTNALDTAMCEAVAGLVGGSFSDWAWSKASLPISFGGWVCGRYPYMLQQPLLALLLGLRGWFLTYQF